MLAAEREHRSPWDIARFYEEVFFADCGALNIVRPNIVCRATEHIAQIIDFVGTLVRAGLTYESEGNLYFDTSGFSGYHQLRGGPVDEAGALALYRPAR